MQKATRKQVKQHNRRLVLRAVYEGRADNRAALAHETGLTKPTVSNIISDLIYRGLVAEVGRGESTSSGGKRPTLLSFVPQAQQIIGISINRSEIIGCLSNLDGAFVVQHGVSVTETTPLMDAIHHTITALMAQQDSEILCISIGLPGIVNHDTGVVESSPVLGWEQLDLSRLLQHEYGVPLYIGNNTEFATRTHITYSKTENIDNLVTVFVDDAIEVGITFGGNFFQHSGNISGLPLAKQNKTISFLEAQNIQARIDTLLKKYPDSLLQEDDVPLFINIRRANFQQDEAAMIIHDEIATSLAQIFAWIMALMRPDEMILAGKMCAMGDALLQQTREKVGDLLPESDVSRIKLADLSQYLELYGAVAYGLSQELGIV